MKSLLLLAWALVPAFGQFGSLATTYDGSSLYFVSNLRQAGTQQPPWGKLFLANSGGIGPLAIRNRDVTCCYLQGYATNAFNLTAVAVAHDGSRLALQGLAYCNYGSPCAELDQAQTDFYDNTGKDMLTTGGRATLSANGRWALLSQASPFGLLATGVVNLVTGQSSPPAWASNRWTPLAIADDGTIALMDASTIDLIRPDGSSSTIPANAIAGAFDGGGATLVWTESPAGQPLRLRILNTATLAPRVLFSDGDSYAPAISDDGRRVLFLSTASADGSPQVFVIGTNGTGLRQISREASGIQSAALSGDGAVAWVLTGDGSLLRLGIDTGERSQWIGPSAVISLPLNTISNAAPGEPVQVTGQRLAPQAGELGARSGSASLPVLSVAETAVTFQVPWEAVPDPNYVVELTIPGRQDPAWVPVIGLNLQATAPQFVPPAVHQDFTLITATSPAVPGEIVTFYAIGLGPVAPAVATGQAAPIAPLSWVTISLTCYAPDASAKLVPAEVLFAGLAPGTIGYYQVNVRLPDSLYPANPLNFQIQCGQGSASLVATFPVHP